MSDASPLANECGSATSRSVLRVAYADPPYLGTSKFGAAHHYGEHHDEAADANDPEWHRQGIARMVEDFPDGWALSLSSPSLRTILPMCPTDARVSAWVKPFASFKPGVNPAYCWEPVIWRGGRTAKERGGREALTVKDFVSANITLKKGLSGAKPEAFCRWLFDLLGLRPGDELVDLFPGTGIMGEVAAQRMAQGVLDLVAR